MKMLFGRLALSVALACGALPAVAQDRGALCAEALRSPVQLRAAHINAPASPLHTHLGQVADAVSRATKGQLQLTLFPAAQLGNAPQLMEQAALGQNLIFYTEAGSLATAGVRDLAVLGGPFLIDDVAQGERLTQSALFKDWTERLAERGNLRILSLNWFDSPRSMLAKGRAFRTPADMAGVKMRVPQAPTFLRTFELLKTLPVALPFSEVYLGLQQGVVDGLEGGVRGMMDANLYEVADTVTLTNHFTLFLGWAMSEAQYQKLPSACRAVLTEAFQTGGRTYSAAMDGITREAVATLRARGIKFVDADHAAYRSATERFYSLFPEWSPGLLSRVRQAMVQR